MNDPPKPLGNYAASSKFGTGLSRFLGPEPDWIAREVVRRFLTPGSSAFISDGSSTFSVGLYLLARNNGPLVLHTNNLALAHEYTLWRHANSNRLAEVAVTLPCGELDHALMMIHGHKANKFAAKAAEEMQYTVLSVSEMFSSRGPAGNEHRSLQIKQHAVERARQIVWIADGAKLKTEYKHQPLVYTQQAWDAITRNKSENMWLVTSEQNAGTNATFFDRVAEFRKIFGDDRVIIAPK